jgi:hypothetical protein
LKKSRENLTSFFFETTTREKIYMTTKEKTLSYKDLAVYDSDSDDEEKSNRYVTDEEQDVEEDEARKVEEEYDEDYDEDYDDDDDDEQVEEQEIDVDDNREKEKVDGKVEDRMEIDDNGQQRAAGKNTHKEKNFVDVDFCFEQARSEAARRAEEYVTKVRKFSSGTQRQRSKNKKDEEFWLLARLVDELATSTTAEDDESKRLLQSNLTNAERGVFQQLLEPTFEFCAATYDARMSTARVLCRPRRSSDLKAIEVFFFDRIRCAVQVLWQSDEFECPITDQKLAELVTVAYYCDSTSANRGKDPHDFTGRVLVATAYMVAKDVKSEYVSQVAIKASRHFFPQRDANCCPADGLTMQEILTMPSDAASDYDDEANVAMWREKYREWQPVTWEAKTLASNNNSSAAGRQTVYKLDAMWRSPSRIVAPLIGTDAVGPSYPRICATAAILVDEALVCGGETGIASAVALLYGDRIRISNDGGSDATYLWGGHSFHRNEKSLHELIRVAVCKALRLLQNRIVAIGHLNGQLKNVNDEKEHQQQQDSRFKGLIVCLKRSLRHFRSDSSLRSVVTALKRINALELPPQVWNSAPRSIAMLNGVLEFVESFAPAKRERPTKKQKCAPNPAPALCKTRRGVKSMSLQEAVAREKEKALLEKQMAKADKVEEDDDEEERGGEEEEGVHASADCPLTVRIVFRAGRPLDNMNQRLSSPWLGELARCKKFERYFQDVMQKPTKQDVDHVVDDVAQQVAVDHVENVAVARQSSPSTFFSSAKTSKTVAVVAEKRQAVGDNGKMPQIMERDCDKERLVGRFLGSGLIHARFDQFLLVTIGDSANGKSLLQKCMLDIFHPYAEPMNCDVLVETGGKSAAGAPQPHIIDMINKRLMFTSEVKKQGTMNTTNMRNLTGGDAIKARRLHSNEYCLIKIYPRIVLNTNSMPKHEDGDGADAVWRRVLAARFNMKYVAPQKWISSEHDALMNVDPVTGEARGHVRRANGNLDKELMAEAPGILRFFVHYCRDYLLERNLGAIPDEVDKMTTQCRIDTSSLQPFFENHCDTTITSAWCSTQVLYDSYKVWCRVEGVSKPDSLNMFSSNVSAAGFASLKSRGVRGHSGIVLKKGVEQQQM